MNRNIAVILTANASGFRAQMLQAAGSVKVFEDRIEGTGSRASRIGAGLKAAFAGMAVAAAMFFANAVSQAVQFEGAMRNVNSISGLSEQSLASLSNQVLELSTRLPQSAKNLAEGLYEISSSGFQGAAGMKVLETSALAASAGLTDTDTASRAIVASLNAYGLSATDAADVSDILFQTVNLGVVSFEELASELGDVVGGASAAGVALDEVGAAVAAMTLSGLSAAESTTSLNRLIQSLIDPSDALAAAFNGMGYESGKAALDALGLHGTMELLREATGGNIETLLQLFPEIRSARGAFALMAADGKNYARTFAGITDETARAGATQRAFNEQMKGLGQQWKLFVNGINATSIRVGTALIPVLRNAMGAVQEFGSTLGSWLQSAARVATPTLRQVGAAIERVGELLGVVAHEVAPLGRALAIGLGAAALGAVHALAGAIEVLAGFLADHPGLVRAVAVAYGGFLVGQLATAAAGFIQLQATAGIGFTALQKWAALQGVFSLLAGRIGMFGRALYGLVSIGNMTGSINALKGAFAGLGGVLTSPALVGTAAVGAIYALQTAMDNSKKHAEEWRRELEKDINFKSPASIVAGMNEAADAYDRAKESVENYSGVWGLIKSSAEVLDPRTPNYFYDSAAAADEASDAYADLLDANSALATAQTQLKDQLGLTGEEARRMLDALDFDAQSFDGNYVKLIEDARALAAENQNAAPAVGATADALETMGDVSGSAADRIESLNDQLDALFGTMLSASDAGIAYQQAIDDLTKSFVENGQTLDINTEEGRNNASAINDAAEAAVEHAKAIAESTGSVAQGVDMLTVYRQGLKDQLVQMGLSEAAAEDYLATLGLAPEDIETLIQLKGADEATAGLQEVMGFIQGLNMEGARPTVELDDATFLDDSAAVGEALAQIGMQNPEAIVTLNDERFTPTAEQVTAWSESYDDSSLRAQAILDIIDPQNKFATLSDAAAGWDRMVSEATATADAAPAHDSIRGAKENLLTWDASSGTSDVRANDQPAQVRISAARDRLHDWDTSSGTGDVLAADYASARISTAKGNLGNWDASSGSADVNVNDYASGRLMSVSGLLGSLDGRTATVTITTRQVVENVEVGVRPQRMPTRRWGGVDNALRDDEGFTRAADGLLANVYQNTGAVYFAEPETGGEAFIPRHGNRARSLKVADEAASWYGADVVPREMRNAGGGTTVITYNLSPNVSVDVRPTVGVDGISLAKAISTAVRHEVDETMDNLRQEVRTR